MTQRYRHTQVGYLTIIAILPPMVAAILVSRTRSVPMPGLVFIVVLLVAVAIVFSSLTIVVDDDALESSFGFGVWRRRVPLAEIASVSSATSSWWEGFGIRVTPRGMLYNVSGRRAVEVERTSGVRFRLGTDEPDALLRALHDVMHRRATTTAP